MNLLVSIIIPIRRGENIDRLLKSAQNSTYKDMEVIVVDEGLERSKQRNIGIKRSSGQYLLFADSDWELAPDLIDKCVKQISFVDALYIPEVIKTRGIFARIRNWERKFYTTTAIDVVRFIRRKDCPLFDESMSGPEDSDWDRRVSPLRRTVNSCYYHYDNIGIWEYFKKKSYYAKSMPRFAQKWHNDKILNWRWRCFGVFFENGKYREFLRNPLMAVCVFSMIFVRGVIYLNRR